MICVSVAEGSLKGALLALKKAEGQADLFEIRLDALNDPSLAPFFETTKKPLLFTYRAREEGGFRQASLEERLALLKGAASLGAFAVDLELSAGEEAISALRGGLGETKLLLSFHDFEGVLPEDSLKEIACRMKALGADIGKIVVTARRPEEALIPLSLIPWARDELSLPLIAFAMGKAGVYSRVVALLLGAPWTYATLSGHRQAAPGQLEAQVLKGILKTLAPDSA